MIRNALKRDKNLAHLAEKDSFRGNLSLSLTVICLIQNRNNNHNSNVDAPTEASALDS